MKDENTAQPAAQPQRRLLWPVLGLALAAAPASGCELALIIIATSDDDGECLECCGDECWSDDGWTEPPAATPPTVALQIADWPPIGPTGEVEVVASSPSGLDRATFTFRYAVTRTFADGTGTQTVRATGAELGEGLGTLQVRVTGRDGAWTERGVANLLVDLSPPTSYFDDSILPASGAELRFWIADAWVVSSYTLEVAGKTFEEQLEPGYPSTFGIDWDYSLVSVPVEEIPVGVHAGVLMVRDAAGNSEVFDFPITIDGIAPTAGITSPADGATLSGTFDVTFTGLDDLPGAVGLELYAGGTLVATGLGPQTSVTLDASELPEGPLEIGARATDEAGNQSTVAVRNVTIVH